MDGGIEMGDLESSAGLAGDDLGLEGRGGGDFMVAGGRSGGGKRKRGGARREGRR
jgi:hypothetical protein